MQSSQGGRGSSDNRTLTLLGLPTSRAANFPPDSVVMNTGEYGRFRTVELSLNTRYGNRWSASMGGSHLWQESFPFGFPNDPNEAGVEDRTSWNFKAPGSYDAAYGIRISPVLRHQSGTNFARRISIPSSVARACGLIYSGMISAEPSDARRQDNIWVFDVRAEKTVNFTSRTRARVFFDLFGDRLSALGCRLRHRNPRTLH